MKKKVNIQELAMNWISSRNNQDFTPLYRAVYPYLKNYIKGLVNKTPYGYRLSADDIVSSAFERMYMNIHTYNSEYKFVTWLYRIAYNEFIASLPNAKSAVSTSSLNDVSSLTESNFIEKLIHENSLVPTYDSSQESMEYEKDHLEKYAAVLSCLKEIDPKFSHILYDHKINGMSCQEISQKYSINYDVVRNRVYHAMNKLHEMLYKKGMVSTKKRITNEKVTA